MTRWVLYGDSEEYYSKLKDRFGSDAVGWFGPGKHQLKRPYNSFKSFWEKNRKEVSIIVIGREVKNIGMNVDVFIRLNRFYTDILVHRKIDGYESHAWHDVDETFIPRLSKNPFKHMIITEERTSGKLKRTLDPSNLSDRVKGLHHCQDRSDLLIQIEFLIGKDRVIYESRFKKQLNILFPNLTFVDRDAPRISDSTSISKIDHLTLTKDFRIDGHIITPAYSSEGYVLAKEFRVRDRPIDVISMANYERRKLHQSDGCGCNDCVTERYILSKYVKVYGGDVKSLSETISTMINDDLDHIEPIDTISYADNVDLRFKRVTFTDVTIDIKDLEILERVKISLERNPLALKYIRCE